MKLIARWGTVMFVLAIGMVSANVRMKLYLEQLARPTDPTTMSLETEETIRRSRDGVHQSLDALEDAADDIVRTGSGRSKPPMLPLQLRAMRALRACFIPAWLNGHTARERYVHDVRYEVIGDYGQIYYAAPGNESLQGHMGFGIGRHFVKPFRFTGGSLHAYLSAEPNVLSRLQLNIYCDGAVIAAASNDSLTSGVTASAMCP